MALDLDGEVLTACYRVFGVTAQYAPPGGGGTDITVVRPDDEPATLVEGEVTVAAAAIVRHVRKAELATPEKNASLAIGAASYTIASFHEVGEGLEWALHLNPA